jgi:hypothetical protein
VTPFLLPLTWMICGLWLSIAGLVSDEWDKATLGAVWLVGAVLVAELRRPTS